MQYGRVFFICFIQYCGITKKAIKPGLLDHELTVVNHKKHQVMLALVGHLLFHI